jgi:ABC-type amino acid transport substrate-binding protein
VFVVTTGIRTSEQVKGKKIGISRFGSNTDYVVRMALNQFALAPNEVQIIQVGGSQARLVALKSGAIQATVLSPEEALVAQKMGFAVLLDFIEKGIEFPHVTVGRAGGLFRKSGANGESFHEGLSGSGSLLQNSPRRSGEENHGAE